MSAAPLRLPRQDRPLLGPPARDVVRSPLRVTLAAALLLLSALPAAALPHRAGGRRTVRAAAPELYGPPAPGTPFDACDRAIAAAERGIPAKLLPAISRVESGRLDAATGRVRAWPWTINVEGVGHFFDTKEQAIAEVSALQAKGVRSIDVGCMQVNLMHHATAFPSLDAAFEPATNAAYAARFLSALYGKFKDWNLATAAYHSQDPVRGEEYQRLVLGRVMTPMGAGGYLATGMGAGLGAKGTGPYAAWPPPNTHYAAIPPMSFSFGAFTGGVGPASVLINPLGPVGRRR